MLRALLCGCYAGCEPPAYQRPPVRACRDYPCRLIRVQGRFLTLYSCCSCMPLTICILAPNTLEFVKMPQPSVCRSWEAGPKPPLLYTDSPPWICSCPGQSVSTSMLRRL